MTREEILKDMISEYQQRITTYQAMIREWERELGVPASAASFGGEIANNERKAASGVDVQPWQFLGKSQPEAAKALLAMVRHPLTTEEIMEGLKRGGVEIGGSKYTFYTILSRTEEVARFRKNTWGLADWPGAQKRKTGPAKAAKTAKAHKRKKAARPRQAKPTGPSVADLAEQVIRQQGGEVQAATILKTLSEQGHSVTQPVLASALGRATRSGRFEKVRPGVYTVKA